jgi:hypothetical protein
MLIDLNNENPDEKTKKLLDALKVWDEAIKKYEEQTLATMSDEEKEEMQDLADKLNIGFLWSNKHGQR